MRWSRLLAGICCSAALLTLASPSGVSRQASPYRKLEIKLESRAAFQAGPETLFYTRENKVIALDRATWKQRWAFKSTQTFIPKLVLDGNAVYALTAGGTLAAFDARTGGKLWSVQALSGVRQQQGLYGNGLYMQVFPSFFAFRDHLMVSQAGELTLLDKRGRRIRGERVASTAQGFSYTVKAFESRDYYALARINFVYGSLPGAPSIYTFVDLYTNDHTRDRRPPRGASTGEREQSLQPFDVRALGAAFLSTQNGASRVGVVDDNTVSLDFNKTYYLNLYGFRYNPDQNIALKREDNVYLVLQSRFRNRQWCEVRWCEFTEFPRDFEVLGVFDDRLVFMTDKPDQRFAYFDLDRARRAAPDRSVRPYAKLEFTSERPAAWFNSLAGASLPTSSTDVFVAGSLTWYVVIEASGRLRIVTNVRVIPVEESARLENFIPSRDLQVGERDVIVLQEQSVQVYQEAQ